MLRDNKKFWLFCMIVAVMFTILAVIASIALIALQLVEAGIFYGATAVGLGGITALLRVNYIACKAGKGPIWT